MKRIMHVKGKAVFFLVSAILVLCAGFIISGCGTDPQLKSQDPNKGNYAFDFFDCPIPGTCLIAFTSTSFDESTNSIQEREVTLEAWVKPKATSTGTVVERIGAGVRGAKLSLVGAGAGIVTPTLTLSRVLDLNHVTFIDSDGVEHTTTTVPYVLSGPNINTFEWSHIAGILEKGKTGQAATDHENLHTTAGVACADNPVFGADPHVPDGSAVNDPWHLDLYINGNLVACKATYGGQTATHGVAGYAGTHPGGSHAPATDPDETFAAAAYAHEPEAKISQIQIVGIIDEARIWNVSRASTFNGNGMPLLNACRRSELGITGDCSTSSSNLILYANFNRGEGEEVADRSGVFSDGGIEYGDPNNPGEFLTWGDGWTTDTPF